jgi:hypothetical protein
MSNIPSFHIDNINSDDDSLFVDIPGVGTVCIRKDSDALHIDVFRLHVSDAPVVSLKVDYEKLLEDGAEEDA